MIRTLTTCLLLAGGFVMPHAIQADCGHHRSARPELPYGAFHADGCVFSYDVYPAAGHGSRRLPGQWWNQPRLYPKAPAANLAYGVVDHGDKPWSLIPGDGYVGSSVTTAPSPDATDTPQPPIAEPTAPAPKEPGPGDKPASRDDAATTPRASGQKDVETPATDASAGPGSDDHSAREPEDDTAVMPAADTVDEPAEPVKPADAATPAESAEPAADDAAAAGAGRSLVLFCLIALALAGHLARRTGTCASNEPPLLTI